MDIWPEDIWTWSDKSKYEMLDSSCHVIVAERGWQMVCSLRVEGGGAFPLLWLLDQEYWVVNKIQSPLQPPNLNPFVKLWKVMENEYSCKKESFTMCYWEDS